MAVDSRVLRGRMGYELTEKPVSLGKTIKRLAGYISSDKKTVVFLFFSVLGMVLCTVAIPVVQSKAIDDITNGDFVRFFHILFIILALYIVECAFYWIQGSLSAVLSQKVVKRMRAELFCKMVSLPISYIESNENGELMSRVTNDIENVSNTISQSASSLFSGLLTIIGTVTMMVYLSPRLAAVSCTTIILTVVVTKILTDAIRKLFRKRQALMGELSGNVEEIISSYRTVIAYNCQNYTEEHFNKVADELTSVGIYAEIVSGVMGPVSNAINNISFVLVAVFGSFYAIKGYITIGIISAFIVYARQFGRPIRELAQVYGQLQTAVAGAERVFETIDETPENKDGIEVVSTLRPRLSFKDVCFSYDGKHKVIDSFNLDIEEGQKIALVGATGSGKTTIVSLLMRFYDIDSGSICIDGVDISKISRDDLRKNISSVLQDSFFFEDTIENNLKYSNENASLQDMYEAAKVSNIDKYIKQLPKGYKNLIRSVGTNMSQGQRQLLSIARAFIAKPKILILDEATSNIDTRTEKIIQDAMVGLMKNRTSLIIAHRLSTIKDADKIIVMDKGSIVETGKHNELMLKKGKYYNLYMTQYAGMST